MLLFILPRRRTTELTIYSAEMVEEAEKWMRETPLDANNKTAMLEKMEITRHSRRDYLSSKTKKSAGVTLKRYPRLADCLEAVSSF